MCTTHFLRRRPTLLWQVQYLLTGKRLCTKVIHLYFSSTVALSGLVIIALQLYFSTENLISRWKALLATAQALLEWTKEMKEKLSKVITDKDRFGVEDHLATCEVRSVAFVLYGYWYSIIILLFTCKCCICISCSNYNLQCSTILKKNLTWFTLAIWQVSVNPPDLKPHQCFRV